MQFATPVPWWGLVLGFVLAAAIAYGVYRGPAASLSFWRRSLLIDLRAAALLLVFLFLLQPMRTGPGPAGDVVVAVLVDHSRSMAIPDADGETRLARAVTLVRERLLPQLSPLADVELFGFGDRLFETTLDAAATDAETAAAAERTDLAGGIEDVAARLAGRPLAGVVVLSDGAETGRGRGDRLVRDPDLRLFAIGVGGRRPGPDREVVSLTAGEAPATGSVIDLTAAVRSRDLDGGPFEIRLLGDGRVLDERLVTAPGSGVPTRVVFRARPRPDAATLYTVEVAAAPGELVPGNNRRSVLVPPAPRPRRLLLVEGAPAYEHTFLKRVWQADPGLELDAVIRKGMNDRGEQTFYVQGDAERTAVLGDGYPPTREALFGYDAVVLANIEGDFFDAGQLESTEAFVAERGGGLLVLGEATLSRRGLGTSALEPAVPVMLVDPGRGGGYGAAGGGTAGDDGDGPLHLTAEGAVHPVMRLGAVPAETRERWRALPPLAGAVAVGGPKPGATVLAITPARPGRPAQPLIAVQRYGAGRTMVFAGRAAWRWRMRMPADDRTYDAFWGQAARWLTGAAREPVTVSSSGGEAPGDVLAVEVEVRDAAYAPVPDAQPVVTITGPDGAGRDVRTVPVHAAAGRYRGELRVAEAGVYRLDALAHRGAERLGPATDWVLVGAGDPELADPWLNRPALEEAAAAGGGRYVDPADIGSVGASILEGARPEPAPIRTPLWHNVWMFLWVVALLAAEWSLRRRWGLR